MINWSVIRTEIFMQCRKRSNLRAKLFQMANVKSTRIFPKISNISDYDYHCYYYYYYDDDDDDDDYSFTTKNLMNEFWETLSTDRRARITAILLFLVKNKWYIYTFPDTEGLTFSNATWKWSAFTLIVVPFEPWVSMTWRPADSLSAMHSFNAAIDASRTSALRSAPLKINR